MARPSLEETLLRGVVWAFIGAIFSFLFVAFSEYLREVAVMPLRILIATVGSAALTALFYGSMRLTVIVTNLTFIAMVIYVGLPKPEGTPLELLILIGSVIGLVVGGLYGWHDKQSRVFRADGKIIAGLFSGGAVALVVVVPAMSINELPYPWSTMLIAPLVILVYISSAYWFVERCCDLLPPIGDGAVVGLGVGSVTGLLFVIMAGHLDPHFLGFASLQPFVERVNAVWGPTIAATSGVCFVVGIARSLLQIRWYDL